MPDAIDTFTPTRRREADDDSSPPARSASSPANHARAATGSIEHALSSWASAPHADYSVASRNTALRADKPTLPRGIELASLATVPPTNRDDPSRAIACPPYVLHAQMQANGDGSSSVAYYAAFNKEAQRVDYVVKPEAVEAFKANALAYKTEANVTMMNGGPVRAYQKESVRVSDAVAHGEWGAATTHLANAWREAVRDPEWYAEVGVSAATAYAGTLTRAAPALRSVVTGVSEEVSSATTVARGGLSSVARGEGTVARLGAHESASLDGSLARSAAPSPQTSPRVSPLRLVSSNAQPERPLVMPSIAAPVAIAEMRARAAAARTSALSPRVASHLRSSDEQVDSCEPYPLGYHRGSDDIHNACADAMGNVFPGSDVVVAGKSFDLINAKGELVEIKTGFPSRYPPEVAIYAFNRIVDEAIAEKEIADGCGLHFVLMIADPNAISALRARLKLFDVEVRPADKDECVR